MWFNFGLIFLIRKYLLDLNSFWWIYYFDIAVLSVKRNSFYKDYLLCKKLLENWNCHSVHWSHYLDRCHFSVELRVKDNRFYTVLLWKLKHRKEQKKPPSRDLMGDNNEIQVWGIFWGVIPIFTMHFRDLQRLEGALLFVMLRWVIICDFNFKRTENHNFTITTNVSQHVEFFHSLIFHKHS